MDKYTVDLDKVLNDFEYSELTDNHVDIRGNLIRNDDYLQNKNTGNNSGNIRKHSINNVFHSLNEYVNTSVGQVADAAQIHIYSIPETIDIVDDKTNNSSSGDILINEDNVENIHNNDENSANVVESEFKNLAEELQDCELNILEKVESIEEKPESIKEESIIVAENPREINESQPLEDNETIESGEFKQEIVVATQPATSSHQLEQQPVEQLNIDDGDDEEEEESPEADQEIPPKTIEEPAEEKPSTPPIVKIGFSNDLDLDESELHQYLEELELEYESQEKHFDGVIEGGETSLPIMIDEKKIVEEAAPVVVEVSVSSDIENITPRPNHLDLPNKIETNDVEGSSNNNVNNVGSSSHNNNNNNNNNNNVINLIENVAGDPGSTPYNNVYIDKELPEDQQQHQHHSEQSKIVESDIETSSASPTFSDVSIETASSSTPSTETVNDDDDDDADVEEERPKAPRPPASEDNATNDNESTVEPTNNPSNESTEEMVGTTDEPPPQPSSPPPPTVMVPRSLVEIAPPPPPPSVDWIGRQAPLWIPDADATSCLHCDTKFTVIKRRHHCRACGLVLCSKCCNLKYHLEYLDDVARVCNKCYAILDVRQKSNEGEGGEGDSTSSTTSGMDVAGGGGNGGKLQPNPNNPLEYCSTIPPHQQVGSSGGNPPPSVLVPVGVLKRKGRNNRNRTNKSVMFCDGIRPGSDLTNLDIDFQYKGGNNGKSADNDGTSAGSGGEVGGREKVKNHHHHQQHYNGGDGENSRRNIPVIVAETKSFIPSGGENDDGLPPTVTINKTAISYKECKNGSEIVETVRNQSVTFCIQLNLLVNLKIINMDCCINKQAWCFTTEGLINVGQDEIVILLELLDNEKNIPKDIFVHINNIYMDAVKGNSIKEMGLSIHSTTNFLGSKNHAGFLFIRPTFQCLQNINKPKEPYLIGILIHKWETPWAKLFPLRLILRLGAEYRYYPTPIISNRFRDSVFVEIGHTIINLLADFRNFSYTLPQIRGLTIHMEDKNTTVTIPMNRYDQVMKSMNNSSDHILAFGGNFSMQADSHLVCIQDTQSNENAYSTHAINIHNKPRKITGASFIVFNGALKSTSGLTAKSSIVEDGLMIQISPEHMAQIREDLRNMKNHTIQCGCVNATSDETVVINWGESDVNFNINVISPIDNQQMNGVPSIRVHNGKDYVCNSGLRLIRWTEVFILQNEDELRHNQDPVDISKISESIAKATCNALVKYLDLLASNNFYKIGIRTTLHIENVSYSAGSNNMKLPPIYMKSLDNELIPVLHRITSNNFTDNAIVLELIFRILNK